MAKYDLIVAGAGGGLIGAIKAAQLGSKVLLIDASPDFLTTCNTSRTTGMFPAAGSRWQRELGVVDSPEIFTSDIMAKTKGKADPVATKALTEVSVEVMEWMADSLNVPWELVTDFHYPGHSVDRCLSVKGRKGHLIMRPIWDQVKTGLFDFMPSTRLVDVELTDGRITAAVVIDEQGNQKSIATDNLLLATNGYGANKELVKKYNPEIAEVYYHGSPHSNGEAMTIGEKVGAELGYLDAYQGHAAIASHANTLVGWATIMQGGFILNLAGDRFGDESSGYSEYAAILNSQPESTGWLIIDQEIHQGSLSFKEYEVTSESGAIIWADSIAELAAKIDLPVTKLELAVSHAADVFAGKTTDPFGRKKFEKSLRAPFAAIKLRPSLFHTQGGLKVTENAEVVSTTGEVIPGLYAAGGAAVGISGHGSAGYLAGNGLLAAVGFAYLAAKAVAAQPS
ncbi:MAG: FAD-dependent oxidoreductase [Candidatus Nanopelagicales bacterium]